MDKKLINKQIRGISNRGALLLVVFCAAVVLIRIFRGYMYRISEYGSMWQNPKFIAAVTIVLQFAVLYPLLFLLYYKCLNKQNGLRLSGAFKKSQRSKGWLFKWIVITIGVSQSAGMILSFAARLFLKNNAVSTGLNDMVITSKTDYLGIIIYGIPVVLLAPVFEELLFRATIYRNNRPMGAMFAAVVTGCAFGIWHMNISQIFMASFCGVFLCLVFEKTKSIKTVMFIHFVNNLISFGITFAKYQIGDILNAGDKEFMIHAMFHKQPVSSVLLVLMLSALAAAFIAGPIMLIVQIVKKRKNTGLSKGDFPYGTWKKTLIFFSAPLTMIAIAAIITLTFI